MSTTDDSGVSAREAIEVVERLGVFVFPLVRDPGMAPREWGKIPQRGFAWKELSTNDPKVIAAWLAAAPPRNIAIDCGKSGLVALDEDEYGAVEKWCRDHGIELPPDDQLYTVRTHADRRHLLFRWHGTTIGNRRAKPDDPYKFDVRATGGYIVAEKSLHVTGDRYIALDEDRPIPPLPEALAAALLAQQRGSSGDGGGDLGRDDGPTDPRSPIPAGRRHDLLVSYAGRIVNMLVDKKISGPEGYMLMEARWRCCEQPPGNEYPMERAIADLEDVARRYGQDIGKDGPDPFELLVCKLHRDYKARHLARQRFDAEQLDEQPMPEIRALDEFLAEPDDPVTYRIEGLWPTGGNVLLAAQFKAGKTTLRDNVIRALADNRPLLGKFAVTPMTGRIVVIDTEMSDNMLRKWLREQHIQDAGRISVVSLRGRITSFGIHLPEVRQRWAERLRELAAEVVILDCLRPILDAFGLSEDKESGRILTAFAELLADAGASESFVVHHMGHNGERSRGDSRLRDWPDVEWRLVRDGDDPAATRYFTAYGRDVDVPERNLDYTPETRELMIGSTSRQEAEMADALDDVVACLRDHPESSTRKAYRLISEATGYGTTKTRAALAYAVKVGAVITTKGGRNSALHTVNPSRR